MDPQDTASQPAMSKPQDQSARPLDSNPSQLSPAPIEDKYPQQPNPVGNTLPLMVILFSIFLLFLVVFVAIGFFVFAAKVKRSPKPVEPPAAVTLTPTQGASPQPSINPSNALEILCAVEKGKWLGEFNECEMGNRQMCETAGGTFNECASACRHNPNAQACTQQCVMVCVF